MKSHTQPSKQKRSLATQERILDATAKILETQAFAGISVRRIVVEAETSIGSFYARFRDKDALLAALYERSERDLENKLKLLRQKVERADSIAVIAKLIAEHVVIRYGENPQLSRELFEFSMRAPESPEAQELSDLRSRQYGFVADALLRHKTEISHRDPEKAIQLGLYFLSVACRNRLFYPMAPQARTIKISKKDLKHELAQLLTRYLTA